MELIRIDKLLSNMKSISRNDVKKLIKQGRVVVNAKVIISPEFKIDVVNDVVLLDNEKIEYNPFIYIMLNKPKGYVSSTSDPRSPTVIDLIPEDLKRKGLFPAGRLDSDSTGFVLITDDGQFAHKILSPKNHVPKLYEVTLDIEVDQGDVEAFDLGVTLYDGSICKSGKIIINDENNKKKVLVELTEGMYHQIKRMFASRGKIVIGLHRIKIGGLFLKENLLFGECIVLTKQEIQILSSRL